MARQDFAHTTSSSKCSAILHTCNEHFQVELSSSLQATVDNNSVPDNLPCSI